MKAKTGLAHREPAYLSGPPAACEASASDRPWLLAGLAARYQPIVGVHDRQPRGVEALARLDHPGLGILAPEQFVPQMEDAGLGRDLTERVAAVAFGDFMPHLAGLGLTLALNFPLQVLTDCAALSALDGRREAAGIAPERILIELTESRPLDVGDPAQMSAFATAMRRLRDLGYGLALDDVGPDTANLVTILDSGFTVMKLDRAVVENSAAEPCAARFLRLATAAAKARGLSVIAEGVADQAAWRRVRKLGVDLVQGYFVSPPLTAAGLAAWAEDWRLASA